MSSNEPANLVGEHLGDLVTRCLAGDQAAVTELVSRFQEKVFCLCYRMVRHRQDAEDAAQESFVRALGSLRNWDSARPFLPWLLAIAGNRCRTLLARRKGRPRAMPPELLEQGPLAVEVPPAVESRQIEEELLLALQLLRDEHRQVFLMFHQDGLSYEEIASAMGRPLGTVKTWVHRARRQLAAQFIDRELMAGLTHELR